MIARTLSTLLSALLILFGGPTPTMASGDGIVICGADGSARVVVFDFETGAPVAPGPAFEECAQCIACQDAAPPPSALSVAVAPSATPVRAALTPRPMQFRRPRPQARGPPSA